MFFLSIVSISKIFFHLVDNVKKKTKNIFWSYFRYRSDISPLKMLNLFKSTFIGKKLLSLTPKFFSGYKSPENVETAKYPLNTVKEKF